VSFSFQRFCAVVVWPYYHLAYRIRSWGRLQWQPRPILVVTNHQHDLDTTGTLMHLSFMIPASQRIYSAGSRRMFEPGFMAFRFRWLEGLIRRFDSTELFSWLGVLPIENELRTRDMSSFAAWSYFKHGDVPITDVFDDVALGDLKERVAGKRMSWLRGSEGFMLTYNRRVAVKHLREPYKGELLADVRENLEPDLQRIERKFRSGVTFYLTAEGKYSKDGRLDRFRETFDRLAPIADQIYLISVSYDVYASRRLSMMYNVGLPVDKSDLRASIKVRRPITVSQLLCSWLLTQTKAWTEDDAMRGVKAWLAEVEAPAFVDPELAAAPDRMTRAALREMTRLGTLALDTGRYRLTEKRAHPQFPQVADMVAFQATFFGETAQALASLGKVTAAV
jgi:hypothetical protein